MKALKALSPLILLLCLYLVASVVAGDFYIVPITVAFLVSSVYAVFITKGTVNERLEIFAKGAGNGNMMLMLWIFLLAGAFANSAEKMGSVDAVVNLTLWCLPSSFLLPGLFIASCLISLSIGTSVGTIAALTPVAVGIANSSNVAVPLAVAIVVGGAYFGDNLSFISDTTIVATQTQHCRMSDKFRVNSRIVMPAALLMIVLYYYLGRSVEEVQEAGDVNFWKVIPYMVVIVSAIMGVNVLLVLVIGLCLSGVIGIALGDYDVFGWFHAMADGMTGMSELLIMTLLAGGMLAIIRHNGGVEYIIKAITWRISGKRGAEMSIALLVCLVNICTANNTVAIMTAGPIAYDIANKYGVDKRKSASILDTTSCVTQGLLPYGAQILIAAGLASVSPVAIIQYLFYPFALALTIIVCVWWRLPHKYA